MKTARRILLGIVLLLIIVLIGAFIFINHIAKRGLPDYNKSVQLTGMIDQVTVYRDSYAVPHIFAKNEGDLYRAVGYVMAQDRLWQMDLLRRVTTGRLSEIVGSDLVETDHLLRALRIPEKSRKVLAESDGQTVAALEAFAAGVNEFIATHRGSLPVEFRVLGYEPEPWTPQHSVNLIGYMAWDLTMSWGIEVALHKVRQKVGDAMAGELIPDMSSYGSTVYPELEGAPLLAASGPSLLDASDKLRELGLGVFLGSNNWAVSGARSSTGKPLLANDMHLGLGLPTLWYQMHQSVEGGLNVTGVVLPGQPFVISGHNGRIAWGMTNVMADDMDFYLEKLSPKNPDEYLFKGSWLPMEVRKETIAVKDKRSVQKSIRYTVHGPVISGFKDIEDAVISMRWAGNEPSNELRSVYLLNRASGWEDFTEALRTFRAVSQNVVYADVDGNIGLACAAGIPVRARGDGTGVIPGWTGEYEWTGFVPFEELPKSYNPPSGFVSSANNKTAVDAYPYPISRWFDLPYRIDRIREMLSAKERLSVEDFKAMQADKKSKLAQLLLPDLIAVLKAGGSLTESENTALEMLRKWDAAEGADIQAAAIFEIFYGRFTENTFADEMGMPLFEEYSRTRLLPGHAVRQLWLKKQSPWFDDVRTKNRKEGFADIVLRSFKEAVEWLSGRIGSDPLAWQWGSIHELRLIHPLGKVKALDVIFNFNIGPYPVGGSFHTVCPYGYPQKMPIEVNEGASQRHIYDLSDWDNSLSVLPAGNSAVPGSSYYDDQTELYVEGAYHADIFSRKLVEERAEHELTLKGK